MKYSLLFVLFFVLFLPSQSWEDDSIINRGTRIKRAKDLKVADHSAKYHANIKKQFLSQIGRPPYLLTKLSNDRYIDSEVLLIVNAVKREGRGPEFNALQRNTIKSLIAHTCNKYRSEMMDVLNNLDYLKMSEGDVAHYKRVMLSTNLISEDQVAILFGKLDSSLIVIKFNNGKRERDSMEKIQNYWKEIQHNAMVTIEAKEHIKKLLELEVNDILNKQLNIFKGKRYSLIMIDQCFKDIHASTLLVPEEKIRLNTVLHKEMHNKISERVDECRTPEMFESVWQEIDASGLLVPEEKTSVRIVLQGKMDDLIRKRVKECNTPEMFESVWKSIDKYIVFTVIEKKRLQSELQLAISGLIRSSSKKRNTPGKIESSWKSIDSCTFLSDSDKSSLCTLLRQEMYVILKDTSTVGDTLETIESSWKKIKASNLLAHDEKNRLRPIFQGKMDEVMRRRVKECNTPETFESVWKEIHASTLFSVDEKVPMRSLLQTEMITIINSKLTEDITHRAKPETNANFWKFLQSSSLFTLSQMEQVRNSVEQDMSVLIENQLEKHKSLIPLADNVHDIRENIYMNVFLNGQHQELLISFVNEYLIDLLNESKRDRNSPQKIRACIEEIEQKTLDRTSKILLIEELEKEMFHLDQIITVEYLTMNNKNVQFLFDDAALESYIYLYLDSNCLPTVLTSEPISNEAFLTAIVYVGLGTGDRMYDHLRDVRNVMRDINYIDNKPLRKIDRMISALESADGRLIVIRTVLPMCRKEAQLRESLLLEYMIDAAYSISNSMYGGMPHEARKLTTEARKLINSQTLQQLMNRFVSFNYEEFNRHQSAALVRPTSPPTHPHADLIDTTTATSSNKSLLCPRDLRRVIVWKRLPVPAATIWVMERPRFSELKSLYLKENLPNNIKDLLPID